MEVVEAALSGSEEVRLEGDAPAAGKRMEQFASAGAEEMGVALLVLRVAQVEAAQERIARHFRGAR
ncbi:MAG: hypothetical protein E6J85_06495 [Deltaproteobacteria bacterium]|nr:MAG: hypothetical protein E6J85_06495 [Deltaproteobacteria bacterium]